MAGRSSPPRWCAETQKSPARLSHRAGLCRMRSGWPTASAIPGRQPGSRRSAPSAPRPSSECPIWTAGTGLPPRRGRACAQSRYRMSGGSATRRIRSRSTRVRTSELRRRSLASALSFAVRRPRRAPRWKISKAAISRPTVWITACPRAVPASQRITGPRSRRCARPRCERPSSAGLGCSPARARQLPAAPASSPAASAAGLGFP